MNIDSIDVLILCGGKGSRLKSIVSDRPKILADIDGLPFIEYLLNYLENEGIRRVILCTGFKHDKIEKWIKNDFKGRINILLSKEKTPLGTAGAVKNAEKLIKSDPFFVINGDTLIKIRLDEFLYFHQHNNAIVSIVTTCMGKIVDSGNVIIDSNYCISDFIEKGDNIKSEKVFINAGIYLFRNKILSYIPKQEKKSLEYDLFPCFLTEFGNRNFGYISNEELLDIGTPENLNSATTFLEHYLADL